MTRVERQWPAIDSCVAVRQEADEHGDKAARERADRELAEFEDDLIAIPPETVADALRQIVVTGFDGVLDELRTPDALKLRRVLDNALPVLARAACVNLADLGLRGYYLPEYGEAEPANTA